MEPASTSSDASVPATSFPSTFPPATRPRSTLVDSVRGLAIMLVVVGHTSQGMSNRGLWHDSPLAPRLDAWMYAFHMSAFFFMAGLFLEGSLAKRGVTTFLRDRAGALLWPYALFESVNMVLTHFSRSSTMTWQDALWSFFTAMDGWFLPSLFFALAVFAVAYGTLRRVPQWLVCVLIASLSARRYCLALPVNFAAAGLFFLPFVVLGAIVAGNVQRVARVPLYIALGAAALLGWLVWHGTGRHWQWTYSGALGLALAGTAMLLLVGRVLENTAAARWCAWCGTASLGIFLLAPYPQVLVRTLLVKLHVTDSLAQLTFPSLAAVLLGAWAYHNRDRLRVRWLFEFPGRMSSGKKPS